MSEQTANLCTTDACESLRARLAKYEDAEGNPISTIAEQARDIESLRLNVAAQVDAHAETRKELAAMKAQPSGVVDSQRLLDWNRSQPDPRPIVVGREYQVAEACARLNSSPVSAGDERKLSDIGNELHNLSCHVVHHAEGWANQLGALASELWYWPSNAGVVDERAAFEAAYEEKARALGIDFDRIAFVRGADGLYVISSVQTGWWAWKARAALTASAPNHIPDVTKMVDGSAPNPSEQVRAPESFIFQYRHAFNGETRTVSMSRDEVADGMDDTLYEKLLAQICECEPVGETNVVDCNCSDYADYFDLVRAPSAGSQKEQGE